MSISTRSVATFAGLVMAGVMSTVLADPPGRVGRISYATGDVAFQNTHNGESDAAQVVRSAAPIFVVA